MAEDPDPVDIDEGILGRQLLDAPLFIGQSVVAEIAVAVVMVPLGALRVATAVADLERVRQLLDELEDKAEIARLLDGARSGEGAVSSTPGAEASA